MTDDEQPGRSDRSVPGSPVAGSRLLSSESFTEASVTTVRHTLAAAVKAAGLSGPTGEDFVLAAHELLTNAVRHGGGSGRLVLRLLGDTLTCEVIDHGQAADGLPVRPPSTNQIGGRGLWLAHHLTGALMLTRRPDGVTASVSVCISEAVTPTNPGISHHGDADDATDLSAAGSEGL